MSYWFSASSVVLLSCAQLFAQVILSEDFSSGSIDPQRWLAVTQGIPQGGAAVFVQGGECTVQNRGHLVSVAHFDQAAIGAFRVQCKWRCADAGDIISLYVRSDGLPSGQYGETNSGVGLYYWLTGQPTIEAWGGLIQIGATATTGPGINFQIGATYTAYVMDYGFEIGVRVEGPDPAAEWLEIVAPILGDGTTSRKIVFHNREQTAGAHEAIVDEILIEHLAPAASSLPFGVGCPGPNAIVPTLAPVLGDLPRIGSTFRLRAGGLPSAPTIPVFITGFSDALASGPAGAYALPADLTILGWPGCQQLVSVDWTDWAITVTGEADHAVVIPPFSALAGLPFFSQALVLYTPSGVAVSNGVRGTVGY